MGGEVTWSGVQSLASSASVQVWNFSLHPLSYVIDLSMMMALSIQKSKKGKRTVEATHVGLAYTSHFFFP